MNTEESPFTQEKAKPITDLNLKMIIALNGIPQEFHEKVVNVVKAVENFYGI